MTSEDIFKRPTKSIFTGLCPLKGKLIFEVNYDVMIPNLDVKFASIHSCE